jgi:NRPS condensation-like uncharacterized protein
VESIHLSIHFTCSYLVYFRGSIRCIDFIPLSFDMGVDDRSPVFRIQVNVMLDGVIVCFAFHHMALDGGEL